MVNSKALSLHVTRELKRDFRIAIRDIFVKILLKSKGGYFPLICGASLLKGRTKVHEIPEPIHYKYMVLLLTLFSMRAIPTICV